MRLKLTPEQAIEAGKALDYGVARFGADAILFGQIRLALAGEDHAGGLVLFAIPIPPATARKVRALLERERIRLAKRTKSPPVGAQRARGAPRAISQWKTGHTDVISQNHSYGIGHPNLQQGARTLAS